MELGVLPAPESVKRAVLSRVAEEVGVPEWKASFWFDEMLKFLSLGTKESTLKPVPSRPVDIAWHNFILLTRPYAEYCSTAFGTFIHHDVNLGTANESEQTSDHLKLYAETRTAIRKRFGSLDPEVWPDAIDWRRAEVAFKNDGYAYVGEIAKAEYFQRRYDDRNVTRFAASEPALVAVKRLLNRVALPTRSFLSSTVAEPTRVDCAMAVVMTDSRQRVSARSDVTAMHEMWLEPGTALVFDPSRVDLIAPEPAAVTIIEYEAF